MHVTEGNVSVRHQTQHRAPNRIGSVQTYAATTTRILRQLAADHRSVTMIMFGADIGYHADVFHVRQSPAASRNPLAV